jgi:hypothetical protein
VVSEDWTFRAAIFSISQKKDDANGMAKAKQRMLDMLRSDYRLTLADQQVLADYIEGKLDRPVGRPTRNIFNPVHKAVGAIRASQEKNGYKRKRAIAAYRLHLQLTKGEKAGAAHFKKYESQITEELRRAKPRKNSR